MRVRGKGLRARRWAACALALLLPSTAHAATRYVSPHGSDHWRGTARHPWRTLTRAVRSARPGDRIVFLAGVYGARGHKTFWTASGRSRAPIVFEGDPHGRPAPTILGENVIRGSHLDISGLRFMGPTGPVDPRTQDDPGGEDVLLWLTGRDIALTGSEVTGDRWHAGVYVDGLDGIRLACDYIHDNGAFSDPAQANLDHGVYWAAGTGRLEHNLIVHNQAMGIQLYPAASLVLVTQNAILDNGRSGIILAKDVSKSWIVGNIFADNLENGVQAFDLAGAGNLVESNVFWNNREGNIGEVHAGLTVVHNAVNRPSYVNADGRRVSTTNANPLRAIGASTVAYGRVGASTVRAGCSS